MSRLTPDVRRVPFEVLEHRQDSLHVRPYHRANGVWVDSWVVDALERLRGFCPIDAHVAELRERLGYDDDDARELHTQLTGLRDAGLLMTWAEIVEAANAHAAPRLIEPIDVLVVVACGKPEFTARALRTFVDSARPREVLVVDDSDASIRPAMIEALRQVDPRGAAVSYAGERQKRVFGRRLGDRLGPDFAPSLELALHAIPACGRTTGANHNAALLATAGRRLVCIDDDTFAPLAGGAGDTSAAGLTASFDPTALWFFNDLSDAVSGADAQRSAMDAHARALGQPLAALDLHNVGALTDEALVHLLTGRGRVRATMTGIAGDVGMTSTHSYMCADGPSRARLVDGGYEALRLTRAMHRAVSLLTIGRPGFFMTPCAGFDNRETLPPMFPFDRFQDHLFSACLRRAEDDAYLGWLPELVRHEPGPRPRGERESLFSPTEGIHTALHALMAVNVSRANDLVGLGRSIEATTAVSPAEYRDFVEEKHAAAVTRRLEQIEQMLEHHDSAPAAWAADIGECGERWRALFDRPDPSMPLDLVAQGHAPADAWQLCQRAVRDFGLLMQRWPQLCDEARQQRAAGIVLGDRIESAAP